MGRLTNLDSRPDFRVLFESAPGLYLVLTEGLKIVAASDAYLRATMTKRADILGRDLFEVFPDNPHDPAADGVRNLTASLKRVRTLTRHDVMTLQRYDVRDRNGVWQEKYWHPANWPIVEDDGSILALVHHVMEAPAPEKASAPNEPSG